VIGFDEVTISYEAAAPHIKSPPGAVQLRTPFAVVACRGTPGGIASRV
jgi:hypothetical protein